jgi:hypothetical protein
VKVPTFFGAIFALIGVAMCCYSSWLLALYLKVRKWPCAQGRVIRSEVESSRDSDGDPSYNLGLTYEYAVDGQKYQGHRRYPGPTVLSGQLCFARRGLRKFPSGSIVRVSYDAEHPEESYLRAWPSALTYTSAVGLYALLGGLKSLIL